MASEHAMLILLRESPGNAPQERWILDKDEFTIGRDARNPIHLPNRQVSRRHARLKKRDDGFVLEDLGSKNGTFVNGERIQAPHRLQDGDIVNIGVAYRLTFVDSESTIPLAVDPDTAFALRLDEERRRVTIHGQPLEPPLSPAQFELLRQLYMAEGQIVARENLIVAVWGRDAAGGVTDQALDALVRRLRRRLAELAPEHDFIVTVRGHGFRLNRDSRG